MTAPTRSARLVGLVRASHAGPTAMVTAMSGALLVGAGAPVRTVLVATAAVLTGQLSVGWSNDWIDARRDVAVGRTDKPVVVGQVTGTELRRAALLAVLVCAVLSLATGPVAGALHLLAVAVAWSYNARLKSGPWSWLPYAVSFGLLPAFLVLTLPGRPTAPAWLVVGAGLLGVGAHVANALPDLEDDRATGVHGLPHRLGRRVSSALAPAVLLVAVATLAAGGRARGWELGVAAVAVLLALAAGTVGLARPRSRLPFSLSMAVAALCVVLVVMAGPGVAGPAVAGPA